MSKGEAAKAGVGRGEKVSLVLWVSYNTTPFTNFRIASPFNRGGAFWA
jgi:hypothetical protein